MIASSASMRATAGRQQLNSTDSPFLTLYLLLFPNPVAVSRVTCHAAQDLDDSL